MNVKLDKILGVVREEDTGSGTADYNALANKPQINGVTLSGDKSAADLSLVKNDAYATTGAAGLMKVSADTGTTCDASGLLKGVTRTAAQYESGDNSLLVSKGTLNNVIEAKRLAVTEYASVSASTWTASAVYADYPYECALTIAAATASSDAEVVFGCAEAISGNYAPVCLSGAGTVTIYGKVNTAITVVKVMVR